MNVCVHIFIDRCTLYIMYAHHLIKIRKFTLYMHYMYTYSHYICTIYITYTKLIALQPAPVTDGVSRRECIHGVGMVRSVHPSEDGCRRCRGRLDEAVRGDHSLTRQCLPLLKNTPPAPAAPPVSKTSPRRHTHPQHQQDAVGGKLGFYLCV